MSIYQNQFVFYSSLSLYWCWNTFVFLGNEIRTLVSVSKPPSPTIFPLWTQRMHEKKRALFETLHSVFTRKESNNRLYIYVFWGITTTIYGQTTLFLWLVNICVCTVLLWALDTGKETYIVFMRMKQKKKVCYNETKKKLTSSWMCQLFFVKMYTFWEKSINCCCTLSLSWQKQQKIWSTKGDAGQKSQNKWVVAAGERCLRPPLAHPYRGPCTHLVRKECCTFLCPSSVPLQPKRPVCQQTGKLSKSLIVPPCSCCAPSPWSSEGLWPAAVRSHLHILLAKQIMSVDWLFVLLLFCKCTIKDICWSKPGLVL